MLMMRLTFTYEIYLHYSCALVCYFDCVSNDMHKTYELHTKFNRKHASMVHMSVKLKLSYNIHCM